MIALGAISAWTSSKPSSKSGVKVLESTGAEKLARFQSQQEWQCAALGQTSFTHHRPANPIRLTTIFLPKACKTRRWSIRDVQSGLPPSSEEYIRRRCCVTP